MSGSPQGRNEGALQGGLRALPRRLRLLATGKVIAALTCAADCTGAAPTTDTAEGGCGKTITDTSRQEQIA